MNDQEARLALLQTELSSIDSGIRAFDTIAFQVKGWCVTASLAVAGFAAGGHPRLLVIGIAAIVGFWLVDAQNRAIQRFFIERNSAIRRDIRENGLMTVLGGGGSVFIYGTPELMPQPAGRNFLVGLRPYTKRVLFEAFLGHTLSLYFFLIVCLGVEAIFI